MSGIAGIFYVDGRPLDRGILDQMVQSIAHRGPDGTRAWSEDGVGLGHQMLHTTPESLREKLPLEDKGRGLVLTADARIDNRDGLVAALGLTEHPLDMVSDSELILEAYKKWGERCPERLVGDFAFAIWDRPKQTLFCARDHMGLKPFYYHRSGKCFAFASEIKALFCVPEMPRRLNEVMVADYLASSRGDKVITFYEDILRLPPAHAMVVSRDKTVVKPYWALDPSREVRLQSDEEYAEAFRELFAEAVRCRLRSAFPVGADLSGGLDSSSVVCMARKVLAEEGNTRLHTFSSIPEHVEESDESAFVDEVLAQGGFEAHKLSDERMSPLAYLEDILWYADQPPALAPHFNWGMREATHREGVRVALTGIDGDTVVDQSVGRLLELASGGRWITLAREIDAIASVSGRPRLTVLRRHVIKPYLPERALRIWQALRGIRQPVGLAPTVIRPEFAQEVGLPERLATQRPRPPERVGMSRENHWGNLLSGVWPYAFETNNKICSAFSVDDAHPFFDRRLVEFCLGVPSEQKLTQGYARMIMRRGMAGILPEKVRWRTSKGDYSHTFSYGLLTHDRKILEQAIVRDSHLIDRYVDTGKLRRIYDRFLVEKSAFDATFLVSAVYLIAWLRQEADLAG